jgi:hypothetical protein
VLLVEENIKDTIFCHVTTYSVVNRYQCSGETSRLHPLGKEDVDAVGYVSGRVHGVTLQTNIVSSNWQSRTFS